MIKDIIAHNETVSPNDREMSVLRENFPSCFKEDGSFDIERFKEFLSDKVAVTHEGYELKFLGKNYARLLAAEETTTVISPDIEHNNRPENANSENIYISADNLDALKHLLKSYAGLVKCIYIDPPYNTGSDGFVYNDNFNFSAEELSVRLSIDLEPAERILDLTKRGSASHSAWLMFMYPRLLLARDLLAKDGIIFISIDDNEQSALRLICDDVFGENNFLTCISRATGTPTGGGFDGFVNEMDYILVYSKNANSAIIHALQMTADDTSIYNEIDENGNKYLTRSLRRTGGEDRREDRPTMFYPLTAPDGTQVYPYGPTGYESRWRCSLAKAISLEENGLLEWKRIDRQGEMIWHPYKKFYLNDKKKPGNIWKEITLDSEDEDEFDVDLWDNIEGNKKATRDVKELFDNKKVFETAKPIGLIEKIIEIGSSNGDIVVDFFAGSATTAHAVFRTNVEKDNNRRFILIQLQEPVKKGSVAEKEKFETIDQIGYERIIRCARKLKEDFSETTADLGFKHYTLYEPSKYTLDKIENFTPNMISSNLLDEFGVPTVLTTWLVRDGYGFTAKYETLDFAGYKAYFCGKHLYLIHEKLTDDAIMAICEKLETDANFNPENIVLFGYSFTWGMRDALQINVKRLKDTEKNPCINFDVRY